MLLVIDNQDSFTYNLVQYLQILGERVLVFRNNAITVNAVLDLKPDYIVISPGPGKPSDAGISLELIRKAYRNIPILGVCLGHQCVAEVFEGVVSRAENIMHGKTSRILHSEKGIFKSLPQGFEATRYHSLMVTSVPKCLEITAQTQDKEIMGLRHKKYPVEGVQFHPESIMTKHGMSLLHNFLRSKKCLNS